MKCGSVPCDFTQSCSLLSTHFPLFASIPNATQSLCKTPKQNSQPNKTTRLKQPGIIVPKDHASCRPRYLLFHSGINPHVVLLVTLPCYHSHPATHTTANTALHTSMLLLAPALSLSLSVAIGTDTNSLPPVGVAHVAVKESGS